ncbi:EAL domain-containing protein [Thiomicrospira microaerophila]|uniref:EAL domain-containing protein n=1 Tax=Thiomicrospira microaerophila TaxID=406020 RepID=UPI002010BDC7|nr:EAL domain-containing protein [Thiomicrospira microaerophila]UQB42813.1 EAL domain-containing protein [Thiomicrospira microaerophila]
MSKFKNIVFIGLMGWILSAEFVLAQNPVSMHNEFNKPVYQVGILAFRDKVSTLERWQPLTEYLNRLFDDFQFEPVILHLDELEQAVEGKQVDFVLTQPAHYVLMTYRSGLTSPLASMLNLEGAFVTDHFGGVIFTRSNRDDIVTLRDLKGKRIAAASTTSLGAYQMQAYELLQQGVRLPQDARVLETGQPQSLAVKAVMNGEADVGFVRTGVLEDLVAKNQIDMNQLKLLNAQTLPDFPFITSTRLYPEWPFAAMPHVDKDIARQVAAGLLAIPREGSLALSMGIAGFTIPGDYRTIDLLMRELRLEPFDEVEFTLQDFIEFWFYQLAFALALFLLLVFATLFYMVRRQALLKKERNRLTQALERLRLLNQVVEQSPESIVITDRQGRISYMNPMFETMTGYQKQEVLGKNPRVLQSGRTKPSVYQILWQTLSEGKVWRGELSNKRKNGEVYPAQAIISPVKNELGEVTHFLAIQRDLSQRKQREQRIQELLYVDSLTGLANRNKLLETMDSCIQRYQSLEVKGCLLLLNMTHFRFVNQLHGTDVGDELLQTVGQRLQQAFEHQGRVARLTADQFAVFCENKAEFSHVDDWLKMMGQKALTCLASSLQVKGESFNLDFAIGVAPLIEIEDFTSGELIHQTLSHAEIALKQARGEESIRLVVYDNQLSEKVLETHQLQKELAQAIKSEQLRLFVQPQVLQNKQLVGLECLVRWQHPEKGLLPPGKFIPLAEQSDLIVALGDWVLTKAAHLLAEIQFHSPDITLAVNISPRHFRQINFVERVSALLADSGASPKGLIIEITESLFLDDFDEVVQKMQSLKALGVKFSIDDFGTGYSSLSYLQHLPVDEVKIDRAFVLAMDQYGMERSLVSSIYAMAQQMQLDVVVEGVETEQQLGHLSALKHVSMQGFLFAKPQDYLTWQQDWMKQSACK